MEAIRSSEMSGTTLRTTQRHIPEHDTLQIYCILKRKEGTVKHILYRVVLPHGQTSGVYSTGHL
jgi:hypothetical protein